VRFGVSAAKGLCYGLYDDRGIAAGHHLTTTNSLV
jgi:hypothetical protein